MGQAPRDLDSGHPKWKHPWMSKTLICGITSWGKGVLLLTEKLSKFFRPQPTLRSANPWQLECKFFNNLLKPWLSNLRFYWNTVVCLFNVYVYFYSVYSMCMSPENNHDEREEGDISYLFHAIELFDRSRTMEHYLHTNPHLAHVGSNPCR